MLIKGATGRCSRTDCRLTKGNISPPMVFLCWHIARSFFHCPFYCIKCIFPWRFRKAMALHNWALETISPANLDSYLSRIPAICYQQIYLDWHSVVSEAPPILPIDMFFVGIYSIEPVPLNPLCAGLFEINTNTVLILCLHRANERRRYKVTPSLIGWAQT